MDVEGMGRNKGGDYRSIQGLRNDSALQDPHFDPEDDTPEKDPINPTLGAMRLVEEDRVVHPWSIGIRSQSGKKTDNAQDQGHGPAQ